MKRSIRFRYTLIVAGLIAATVAGSILLNLHFFEKYYFRNKEKTISQMYALIEEKLGSSSQLDDASELALRQYCENSNLDLLILNGNLINNCVFCRGNELELRALILSYAYGSRYDPDSIIAKDENHYVCQAYDDQLRSDFLESFGTTGDRNYFIIMRTPLQNMQENIRLANQFYLMTSVIILMVGTIIAYFLTASMSKPIKKLSSIAEQMAKLDFSVHYHGKEKDEIGVLGNHMNQLSRQLEETISELKAANLDLRRDIEKKEEQETMRQEFLAGVSHELKTPIALIQGYAEGLRDGISEDPESRAWYCDVIIDEASKMNSMVRQLLTLNEIEFGSSQGKMERFDITQMLQGVLSSYQILFRQKEAKLRLELPDQSVYMENGEFMPEICRPIYVWAEELRIEEVLRNYISNAFNHLDGQCIITVTLEEKDHLVRVSVTNTGQPIPEEELDKIWLRFYKVDKARTREYGGNGIGLSIVKAVMDAHGRQCGVYNVSDGVTFWFELDATPEIEKC